MSRVLITGCGSGLGASLATRLFIEGYDVIASVRSLDGHINQQNVNSGSIEYVQMDVTNKDEVAKVTDDLIALNRPLEIVILNAGSYAMGTIETANEEQVRQSFEVNYWGNLNVIRSVLPMMRQQQSGKIIGVSSISDMVSLPCDGYYSASKAAMKRMLESLRYEVMPFGIHVSAILPASFKSGLFRSLPSRLSEADPYYPLLKHWLQGVQKVTEPSETLIEEVENVILEIITAAHPNFQYAAGAMANQVLASLKVMTEQQRSQAIIDWSDTVCWVENGLDGKDQNENE